MMPESYQRIVFKIGKDNFSNQQQLALWPLSLEQKTKKFRDAVYCNSDKLSEGKRVELIGMLGEIIRPIAGIANMLSVRLEDVIQQDTENIYKEFPECFDKEREELKVSE